MKNNFLTQINKAFSKPESTDSAESIRSVKPHDPDSPRADMIDIDSDTYNRLLTQLQDMQIALDAYCDKEIADLLRNPPSSSYLTTHYDYDYFKNNMCSDEAKSRLAMALIDIADNLDKTNPVWVAQAYGESGQTDTRPSQGEGKPITTLKPVQPQAENPTEAPAKAE